ncbi:hypothetical protein [Streptomyces sp. NBC_01443]|uniref:hypothetical protein n=1 Tax=Streptomyces sp. NBC_01443 TaxID=2903868 RepID=UPI00225AFDB1|nr:hypothetical protein [Streptomyces sp. NBC_01443]MCX4630315.1 hypothetical protein [Streptomyces sp. NBC_01443]
MDIPVVARWALLALALVSLLLAVRSLRSARRAGPGRRTGSLLDAADHGLGAVLVTSFALAGEHWEIAVGALALLGVVIAWKGVRDMRARREAKAGPAGPAGLPG